MLLNYKTAHQAKCVLYISFTRKVWKMCFNTFIPFEKVFISHKVKENQITYQKLQGKS